MLVLRKTSFISIVALRVPVGAPRARPAAGRAVSPLVVATPGGWLVRPARAVKVLQAGPLSRCGEAAHVLANVTGSALRVDTLFAPFAQPAAASLARGVAVTPKATYFPIRW